MTPEELRRRMRFSHPDDGVSVRNRQYRWKNPSYEIKNIRTNAEDPGSSTVYYEDTGGNKYKTNAQMFVERFGDFYVESSLKQAIKLMAQSPGYAEPGSPAVENTNPAAIDRSCPNCGYAAMGSAIGAALENGETELKCSRCGFSINIAPDEKFLMARKKMSKLKNAIKKFGQWKQHWEEHMLDLSDDIQEDMYFPGDTEEEDPTIRRIRELEGELGLPPLDLLDNMKDDYLAFLEDEASGWKGRAKKAQIEEAKDYDAEILDGMARCLFVNAWADYAEEKLDANFSQMELMDVAPETPTESIEKAKGLYDDIEHINNVDLSTFMPPGSNPDEGFDKDSFGHYLCMEALGHGVSWKDDHEDHGLKIPNIEAYADMDFSEATLRQMYEEFEKEFPEGDYIFDSEPVFEPKSRKKAQTGKKLMPEVHDSMEDLKELSEGWAREFSYSPKGLTDEQVAQGWVITPFQFAKGTNKIDELNWHSVQDTIAEEFPEAIDVDHNWGKTLMVKAFEPDGSLSPSGDLLESMMGPVSDYPLLDDASHSDAEYEAHLEAISGNAPELREDVPEDWEKEVFDWLWTNRQDNIFTEDSGYDFGGLSSMISSEDVCDAADALGFLEHDEEEEEEDIEGQEPWRKNPAQENLFKKNKKEAQEDPFTFKISIANFPMLDDITSNNIFVGLEEVVVDTNIFMIKHDGVYTTNEEDALGVASLLDMLGWEVLNIQEQYEGEEFDTVKRDSTWYSLVNEGR